MKLAIVCEMPRTERRRLPASWVESNLVGHSVCGDGSDIDCQITEEDRSAHAERSAKDAFAYCHGPFGSMDFEKIVNAQKHEIVFFGEDRPDWFLLMGHDCLVDIQAFEVFAEFYEECLSCGKFCLEKWTTAGQSMLSCPPVSKYTFSNTKKINDPRCISPIISKRILIEPETETTENIPHKEENAASPHVCQRPEFSWRPVTWDCRTCVMMACPLCGSNQRPPSATPSS